MQQENGILQKCMCYYLTWMNFDAGFLPVRGQWFPEFHTVVPTDIAILGGIS